MQGFQLHGITSLLSSSSICCGHNSMVHKAKRFDILSILAVVSAEQSTLKISMVAAAPFPALEIFIAWVCGCNKQVAQRATIAHLSPMCQHPFISNKPASKVIKNLNSFQIRQQLFFQGLVPPMSAV